MPTLITAYDAARARTRTCDARCYNATNDDCDCCCGGVAHGQGYDHALSSIATWYLAIREAAHQAGYDQIHFHPDVLRRTTGRINITRP